MRRSSSLPDPPQLEPHTLVLLRWPETLPELTEEELDALQAEHVAYQRSLRERGIIAVAGPFDGQPDERWRGISIYRVGPEEAREYIEQDPSVKRGRLTYDVWTWLVPVGELRV
ncbi:MAG TPA: YciI family protein [Gaiellaceae bacterium]|nr:YciI family protein [Gaiellaceae bacterium]